MKFLVTGSRDWLNRNTIEQRLSNFSLKDVLIHGDAKGADRIAKDIWSQIAGENKQIPYPAQWNKYGKSAGPIRNRQMLSENSDIELVIAFNENISTSKGTKNMIEQAIKAGIPVEIIREDTYDTDVAYNTAEWV